MTKQGGVTGPPIAMDRPAGQPADLPKEGNTRIVELPQGTPRHDQSRKHRSTPIPSQQKEQPALLATTGAACVFRRGRRASIRKQYRSHAKGSCSRSGGRGYWHTPLRNPGLPPAGDTY